MQTRNFINSLDLSPSQYDRLFDLADRINQAPATYAQRCQGKVMASLFYEPSTRTRLSFEAAMLRLGGQILTVADPKTSSAAKGESLADTIRTIAGYADLVVMRHPREGAAQLAGEYSPVPLINGGDGAREHPTQTLTDLFTIRTFLGRLQGLTVALCGDLRYGRTVHSLIRALARLGNQRFVLVSPDELRLPSRVLEEAGKLGDNNTFDQTRSMEDALERCDVLYITRIQKERFFNEEDYIALRDTYVLTAEKMKLAKPEMIVMHPLPRVTEIDADVDSDSRAVYFEQARLGMIARMALILDLLEGGDDAAG